ncbi:MAG: TonB-dependent receptor [Bacteroidales bacterium]|jgi:TonB-linked SusC/RagA family outer membrane protein|nr:TonB-dependent receptor [Bacteroidales bacterium]
MKRNPGKERRHRKNIFLVCLLVTLSCSIFAQQGIPIRGTVTDAAGEPLPGVNVAVKGTTVGVVTDAGGKYAISVPGREAVLLYSFIGYMKTEQTVGDRTTIDVSMNEDMQQIEEVVVVGYGTQKKVNLTGSVSSVDMSTMTESRPITSLSSGLAGLASGVTVTATSGGQPGWDGATIRVRGQGTTNNSDPLVVIDGVAGGNINDVNPQDVESISVLKDAASSSIYGSRAANGVILITTKRGRAGVARINYHGYMSSEKLDHKVPYVTSYADYMELINEGMGNSNVAQPFSREKINEWRNAGDSDPLKYPNSDWQDYLYEQAWMQNHALSISGGAEKIHYFVSGNYLKNPGIMVNSGYDRISARANLDVDIKPWFNLGVNGYGYKGIADIGWGTSNTGNPLGYLNQTSPGWLYRHPDGRFGGGNNSEDGTSGNNALAIMASAKGDVTTNKIASQFFGRLTPFEGLSIEGSYTYDFTGRLTYQHSSDPYDLWNFYDNTVRFTSTPTTSVANTSYSWTRNQMDAVVRYETDVSRLNIRAMAGVSQESYKYQWFTASKQNLTSVDLTELNAATANAAATGDYTSWAMRSFFSRVGLNWAEKYLLEANLRMDWSSRFASGKTRRGVFPAFSAGWRISEEDFMRDISWLNHLKLRVSCGSVGNNAMGNDRDNDGNYSYLPLYASQNYVLNNTVQVGWAQTALSNAAITWETTYVSNLGIDFGILKSRLNGSVDFFVKTTKDILIDLPAPLVHGSSSIPRTNAGEVRNTGLEFTLSWNDRAGDVRYFIEGNFGYVKNRLTRFKGEEMTISGTNVLLEGQPINIQYVMKVDRLVTTDEDLAYVQSLADKTPNYFRTYLRPEKGDFLYADTNGDDDLTADDRIMMGNGTNPTVTYGARLGASWKGVDFSCLLQGVAGYNVYFTAWEHASYFSTVVLGHHINKTVADGRWYEGRPDKATFPKLRAHSVDANRNNTASDFWMVDRSYFRVKNIQLGYTVPKTVSQKILLENIRFYMSIDNALTFTKFPGLDPERGDIGYPTFRITSFGVNLTF